MPRTDRKREKRSVRAARHRAAFHADRASKAADPLERFKAVEDRLLSAAKHSRRRQARLEHEVATLAAEAVKAAELAPASRELYEAKLARADLGTALMCLRAALQHYRYATERDELLEHYTETFAAEAARIEEGR